MKAARWSDQVIMPNAMLIRDELNRVEIIDFGISDYEEILKKQELLFERLVTRKKEKEEQAKEFLLIGEHPPVITIGRRGKESNIIVSKESLQRLGIRVYNISRGGDVTYHCPGQMIAYPILDLERHRLGVKSYIDILEKSVIILLSEFGIKGDQIEGATGVWIGKGTSEERKICAMGVKCSRFCTMHGIALNVNTNLNGFSLINPCGFIDKGVTSIQNEIGQGIDMDFIKKRFSHIFLSLIFSL